MEAPKPTPLTLQQQGLLEQLIAKLQGWEKLLTMGKPGANRLRQIIRDEWKDYERKLERERPCPACVGSGRGHATDPFIPCATCKGSGLASDAEVAA